MLTLAPIADAEDERLALAAYLETWPHESFGIPELHGFKASLADYVDLLAREDGVVRGSGFAAVFPGYRDRVTFFVTVPRPHRRRGVGTAIYGSLSEWARERGLEQVVAVVADDDPESLAFATKRGFVEERREKGLALDLTDVEPPPVEPPEGVEIVTWAERPELVRGIYDVWVETVPDIPGNADEELEPFDDWVAHTLSSAGDRADATFLAVAGDEVVGYAKFSISSTAPLRPHHDLTGVKRAWRGRGVARALKAAQIRWAKANGCVQLRTQNEERNAPIRKLNAEFGYRPWIGRIFLRGPLA